MADYEEMENVENQAITFVEEGEVLANSGKLNDALQLFNKAISIDPANSMAWFNRGVILDSKGDVKGARQSFEITLDLDKGHGPAAANLAITLDRLGHMEDAFKYAKIALGAYPGHPLLTTMIDKYSGKVEPVNEENWEDVSGWGSSKDTPNQITSLVESGITTSILMSASKDEGGIKITEVSEDEPELRSRSEYSYDESEMEEIMDEHGIEDIDKLITEARLHDEDANYHLDKEELASAAKTIEVIESMRIEEIKETSLPEPAVDYEEIAENAMNLLKSGNPQGAYDIVEKHLNKDGMESSKMWTVAGGSLARIDRIEDAISAFKKSVEIDSNNAQALYNLGVLQQKVGDISGAINSLNSAISIDSAYEKAATKLVEFSKTAGNVELILKGMRTILGTNPKHPYRVDFARMLIEIAEGEEKVMKLVKNLPTTLPEGPELASESLQHLDSNNGRSEEMLVARAKTIMGIHSDAISHWKGMLATDKENEEIWHGLAKALDAAGEVEAASKCRNKAKELSQSEEKLGDANELLSTAIPENNTTSIPQIPKEENNKINELLSTPVPQPEKNVQIEAKPEVDLAKAALDAAQRSTQSKVMESSSTSISNQDVEWFNKGIGLMGDEKYREALSCFDRALPSFRGDDKMVIKILNSRGDALYGMEKYPECIDSYHKAMLIDPKSVEGRILYNMGVAYGELKRFSDATKCFEQAIGRGLQPDQVKMAKEQIRRCKKLM